MTDAEKDEQFYRDTHSVAFPKLDDRQLEMLEKLGKRRVVRRGEVIYKAGQRDIPMTVILTGQMEVFELCDGVELELAVGDPRDFMGDVSMLNGTSTVAHCRGRAEESEIL